MVAASLVGFGVGRWAFGNDETNEADASTAGIEVPAHVQAIHDEWVRTWNQADGEAAVALFENGGPLACPFCGSDGEARGDELVRLVEEGAPWVAPPGGWSIADVEILSVANIGGKGEGDGDLYDRYVVVSTFSAAGREGWFSIMRLGDAFGEFRIVEHHLSF